MYTMGFYKSLDRFLNFIYKPIHALSLTVSGVALITVGIVGMFYTAHLYIFGTILTMGLTITLSLIVAAVLHVFCPRV